MDKENSELVSVQLGDEYWKYGKYVRPKRSTTKRSPNPGLFLARLRRVGCVHQLGSEAAEGLLIEAQSQVRRERNLTAR